MPILMKVNAFGGNWWCVSVKTNIFLIEIDENALEHCFGHWTTKWNRKAKWKKMMMRMRMRGKVLCVKFSSVCWKGNDVYLPRKSDEVPQKRMSELRVFFFVYIANLCCICVGIVKNINICIQKNIDMEYILILI